MADTKVSNASSEQQKGQTTAEWAKEKYNEQYDVWMPWIEDVFLKYFTKDNRTSYATRDTLNKTKVTGIDQVDQLQDGTNNLAANTLGQGGILEPIGDMGSQAMKAVDPRGKDRPDIAKGKIDVDGNNDNNNKILGNVPVVSNLGL